MQTEIYQKYGDQYCDDEIFQTGGHKLPCSHVFHGVLMQYDGKAEDSREFHEEVTFSFICFEQSVCWLCKAPSSAQEYSMHHLK